VEAVNGLIAVLYKVLKCL